MKKLKKKKLIIIIVCIVVCLMLAGGIFLLTSKHRASTWRDNKEENVKTIAREDLDKKLMDWGLALYDSKSYDKCVQKDGECFISLASLEKDYKYDISLFKQKGSNCNLENSGLFFKNEESSTPFYGHLSGCKFLKDYQEENPIDEPTLEDEIVGEE